IASARIASARIASAKLAGKKVGLAVEDAPLLLPAPSKFCVSSKSHDYAIPYTVPANCRVGGSTKYSYSKVFEKAIKSLKDSGRYRMFKTMTRNRGNFPLCRDHD